MQDFWDYFVAFLLLAAFVLPLAIALMIKLGLFFLGLLVMVPASSRASSEQKSLGSKCEEL